MLGFTKEESRISLIAAGSALLGSLLGATLGLWGTYAKFTEDKRVQTRADRNRAYTQLKGQQAEFLLILQQTAVAFDKASFYQTREAQQMMEASKARPPKGVIDQEVNFTSVALQQERNAEHYSDELVTCSEKLFESIGLIQLSFPADATLSEKISNVEAILTRTDDIFPKETMRERVLWAMTLKDAGQAITNRQKQRIPYIQKAIEPITDLLTYLQSQIQIDPR
jgi:hypothetical protein